jgi:hypothetical protein
MVGDGISALGKASLKLGKIGIESGTNALNRAAGALKELGGSGTNALNRAAGAIKMLGEGGAEGVKEGVNSLIDMFKRK